MVRIHSVGVLVALCLMGTACGSDDSLVAPNESPVPSLSPAVSIPEPVAGPVTGKYLGTSPTALGYLNEIAMFQMALELREVNGAVTGSWGVVDFPDGGPVTGTVEDGSISLRLTSGDSDYRIEGTLTNADGATFSGTLEDCDSLACSDPTKAVAISFTRY